MSHSVTSGPGSRVLSGLIAATIGFSAVVPVNVWAGPLGCEGRFFGQRVISTAASGAQSVFAADIDGDGDPDVLSASLFDDKIAWHKNIDGLGTFGPQRIITDAASRATSVYAADLDGDGDIDVLSASQFDGKIAWYENTDGLGTFGPQQVIAILGIALDVFAADFDGDGDIDVLSASSVGSKIAWYENTDGLGSFGPQQVISTTAAAGLALTVYAVDLDGDGDIDVLSASSGDNRIAWYENGDGLGTFGPEQVISFLVDNAQSVFAVDLDGDGDADVLSASSGDNKIAWYENTDGFGSFGPQQVITIAANSAQAVLAGDLDGDGDTDVLSASNIDDTIAWYENTDGLGTFGQQQVISTVAAGAVSVAAADLDGDGDIDVLSASFLDDMIAWYKNETDCNGNGINDGCDLADGTSLDCNGNAMLDDCELAEGSSSDCNGNGVPDDCEDCNGNGLADSCDVQSGTSNDCDMNGVPDECETDCNGNGLVDFCDLQSGASIDCDGNGIPDECETDCNSNGVRDDCDLASGTSPDCDDSSVPDECEIADGTLVDSNGDGIPDDCYCPLFGGALTIAAQDTDEGDQFGSSIAVHNEWLAVGGFNAHVGDTVGGSVYLFRRSEIDGSWPQIAKLVRVPRAYRDQFGTSVDLDGERLIVGASGDDANFFIGAAYIFRRDDNGTPLNSADDLWIAEANLLASDGAPQDTFGGSVAIDGDVAVVGATGDDDLGNRAGAAYVYRRDDGDTPLDPSDDTWIKQAKLLASDGGQAHRFGISVAVVGSRVLVGSLRLGSTGGVYVFENDDRGTPGDMSDDVWVEVTVLAASDSQTRDFLGLSIAAEGSRLVAGASQSGNGSIGAAYVFRLDDNGTPQNPNDDVWTEESKLVPTDGEPDDSFGQSVSIRGDHIVVGALLKDVFGVDTGQAYVFKRNDNGTPSDPTDDGWIQFDRLIGPAPAGSLRYGEKIAVGDDRVFVSNRFDNSFATRAGAVHIYPLASDCNEDNSPDRCDISEGRIEDLDADGVADACQDCNNNGIGDDVDIASGNSADCNGNSIPDECEPECNNTGRPDSCDIADGISTDCNGDAVPDECEGDCDANGVPDDCELVGRDCDADGVLDDCEIASGSSDDCNSNGLPDECDPDCNGTGRPDSCDIADGVSTDCDGDGVPDECEIDCDVNGIPDDCELPGRDCDSNGVLDVCELADRDCDGDGVLDACEIPGCACPAPTPTAGLLSVGTNRYLAIIPTAVPEATAMRVTAVDLPDPYAVFNGLQMWIGPPTETTENAGAVLPTDAPGAATYFASTLECAPQLRDWDPSATVYVYHAIIVPGGVYEVQSVVGICGLEDESGYSLPLQIDTSKWGDLVENCATTPCGPPDGSVDVVTDVVAIIAKFGNRVGAPLKARADINPAVPDRIIDIGDITRSLDAFSGRAYPFVLTGDPCGP